MDDQAKSTSASVLRSRLDLLATVLMIIASAAVIVAVISPSRNPPRSDRSRVPVPKEPVSIVDAPALGSPHAAIVLVQYSEFECPFCGRFAQDTLPTLTRRYVDTGKILLVFKHLPLPMHKAALTAAVAADCAGRQGRFWQMHDILFTHQSNLSPARITSSAATIGLDLALFAKCTETGTSPQVQADLAAARTLQLSSTPIFLAGVRQADGSVKVSQVIQGARPVEDFVRVLDTLVR